MTPLLPFSISPSLSVCQICGKEYRRCVKQDSIQGVFDHTSVSSWIAIYIEFLFANPSTISISNLVRNSHPQYKLVKDQSLASDAAKMRRTHNLLPAFVSPSRTVQLSPPACP